MCKKIAGYAYSYGGSALAAQRPFSKKKMLKLINDSMFPERFEVFELVPVEPVSKPVVKYTDFA